MTDPLAAAMTEVHRWRGTPQQRAIRGQVRKLGQFAYFDTLLGHPDWRGRKVLDFGGCDGNLLRNPDCRIDPGDYTCIDVVREAIEEGRRAFPRARWIHYDRYNCSFNPDGVRGLPVPGLGGGDFDFILAYSVFTHTAREEMHELVAQLRAGLASGGALAFTFEDPHYRPWPEMPEMTNLRWRMERFRERPGFDPERTAAPADGAEWCALVDGTSLAVNDNGLWAAAPPGCMTYDVYFTAAFLQREFPEAEILAPVHGEMQHCCVLRRPR